MNDVTKDNATTGPQKIALELTEEQKKLLTEAFGREFEGRVRSIEVEKIAGYLKAEAHAN